MPENQTQTENSGLEEHCVNNFMIHTKRVILCLKIKINVRALKCWMLNYTSPFKTIKNIPEHK